MTVGIDCTDCGEEVVFIIQGSMKRPTATCEGCGSVYQLRAKKIV